MFLVKKGAEDTWVYRKYDEETEHYIIEDGMCNEFEMDYFENERELVLYINISMDFDTELQVVPVSEVIDCPITDGFFIY